MKRFFLFLLFVLGFPLNAVDNYNRDLTFADVFKAQMRIVSSLGKNGVQFSLDEKLFFIQAPVCSQEDADNLAKEFFIKDLRNLAIDSLITNGSEGRQHLIKQRLGAYGFLRADQINYYIKSLETDCLIPAMANKLLENLKGWINEGIEDQIKIAPYLGKFTNMTMRRMASSEFLTEQDIAFLKSNPIIAKMTDNYGNDLVATFAAHGRVSCIKKIREEGIDIPLNATNRLGYTGLWFAFLRIFKETYAYLSAEGATVFYTEPKSETK